MWDAVTCPAFVRGAMTADPDEVRTPSHTQSTGLERPDKASGYSGCGPVDHHPLHTFVPTPHQTETTRARRRNPYLEGLQDSSQHNHNKINSGTM